MNRHLELLLSSVYDGAELAPEHRKDLAESSGLSRETIGLHKFRSPSPDMWGPLLGYRVPAAVRSVMLIPFPSPCGGFFDHVKVKTFGDDATGELRGDHVEEARAAWRYNSGARKYLVRRRAGARLYFPIPTMARALEGPEPLWVVEGMKKSLAVGQLGLPAVGLESAWGWHVTGSRRLLLDFDDIRLKDRIVELVPDSDVESNPMIALSMRRLSDALRAVGARPRLVRLLARGNEKVGVDDYLIERQRASA